MPAPMPPCRPPVFFWGPANDVGGAPSMPSSGGSGFEARDPMRPEFDRAVVQREQRRAMADGDERLRPRRMAQHFIEHPLGRLIERGGRFVEEDDARAPDQDA